MMIKKRTIEEKVDYLIGEFALLKVQLDTMVATIRALEEQVHGLDTYSDVRLSEIPPRKPL